MISVERKPSLDTGKMTHFEQSIVTKFHPRIFILLFGLMGFLLSPTATVAAMQDFDQDSTGINSQSDINSNSNPDPQSDINPQAHSKPQADINANSNSNPQSDINPLLQNPKLRQNNTQQQLVSPEDQPNLHYSRWSRGLLLQGTLGATDLRDNRPSLLFTPFLQNRIRPDFGATISADIGLINSTEYRTRIISFKGELQYYPLTDTIHDDGIMHRRIDPFLFAGIGLMNYAHLRVLRPDDPLTTDAGTTISASSFWDFDNNFALQAPIGAGADIWLEPAAKLTVRTSFQLTGTDRLEALSDSRTDGYWTLSIGLSFRGKVPPKYTPLPPPLPEPLPEPVYIEEEEVLADIVIEEESTLEEPDEIPVIEPQNILFDLELYSIRSEYEMTLQQAEEFLVRNPARALLVLGHTDASGSQRLNDMLGYKRAWATKLQLIEAGIKPQRIFVESRGENEPIASNQTEEGRRLNRRDEFVVVEQQDVDLYTSALPSVTTLAERPIEEYPALPIPSPGFSFEHRNIFFPTQTANLPETSFETIFGLYQAMTENPQMAIVIVGRSEGLPNRERINRLTGESRASRIMEILVNSGIEHSRIRTFAEMDYVVEDPFRGDILIIRTR